MIFVECIKCGTPHEFDDLNDFNNGWPWYCKECNFILKIEGLIPEIARGN